MEYEGSSIFLPVHAEVDGKQVTERVKLRAFMRAELWPAYLGGLGTREFQFVIRDWELFGASRLLSRLYFGDSRGRLKNEDHPEAGREQVVMTWTLAHHYVKQGDDGDNSLGPVSGLRIDGVTDHNTDQGDLYWQVTAGSRSGVWNVRFFREAEETVAPDDVVAHAAEVEAGASFVAESPVEEPQFSYKLPFRRESHGHGLSVSWTLGRDPKDGARGKVRINEQPKSICIADDPPIEGLGADSSDFPAHIIYTANFEVWANGTQVAGDQMGIAHAKAVRGIPPRDVKVAFEKPIQGDGFSFASGMCLGMHEITREEFLEGVEAARAARSRAL
ncbi:hypothetical protein [Sinosporangium album]|uniref:hypothetical protein n=1 Tax=Sinosporangium album TaxID=504805 RepID=UPI000B82F92A|nr:hypothetical protein [Sinosporangium album]